MFGLTMMRVGLEQIVKMEDLDASLVSSGKTEAEAALARATDEVCCLRFSLTQWSVVVSLWSHCPQAGAPHTFARGPESVVHGKDHTIFAEVACVAIGWACQCR